MLQGLFAYMIFYLKIKIDAYFLAIIFGFIIVLSFV